MKSAFATRKCSSLMSFTFWSHQRPVYPSVSCVCVCVCGLFVLLPMCNVHVCCCYGLAGRPLLYNVHVHVVPLTCRICCCSTVLCLCMACDCHCQQQLHAAMILYYMRISKRSVSTCCLLNAGAHTRNFAKAHKSRPALVPGWYNIYVFIVRRQREACTSMIY